MSVLLKSRAGPLDRYSYHPVAARIAHRTQDSLFRFPQRAVNKKPLHFLPIKQFFSYFLKIPGLIESSCPDWHLQPQIIRWFHGKIATFFCGRLRT